MLEAWKAFEQVHGSDSDVAKVQGMMPIVGRKQHVDKETGQVVEGQRFTLCITLLADGSIADWELVFADDEREANPRSFKFLQMAHAWKQSQAKKTGGSTILSGFTPATSSALAPARSDDVQMEERREQEDSRSDVASSDSE